MKKQRSAADRDEEGDKSSGKRWRTFRDLKVDSASSGSVVEIRVIKNRTERHDGRDGKEQSKRIKDGEE